MSPPVCIGLAALARTAFEGGDLTVIWDRLIARVSADPTDAAALMDLSTMLLLNSQIENGLAVQAQALALSRVFERPAQAPAPSLRLLAIMTAGDMMANTPLDFLLEGSDIALTSLFVDADASLPEPLPEHDLAFLAIGESAANARVLRAIAPALANWPRPLLNGDPARIAELTRDGACALLDGASQILAPKAARVRRDQLAAMASGDASLADLSLAEGFPIIARPVGTHAGGGMARLENAVALGPYLAGQTGQDFYICPFIDYAGPDGLYRKHRIVVIEGRPFVCHMAVSPRWMVHYLNADMLDNPANRLEEARFMATFDPEFAPRHQAAFAALHERLGLDYFGIDSAETADGRLLVFEVDVAMIVHDMDPPDLFPYKQPQMTKVFEAFQAMLRRRAAESWPKPA